MNLRTLRGIRLPASSLTTIASRLAPTKDRVFGVHQDQEEQIGSVLHVFRNQDVLVLCSQLFGSHPDEKNPMGGTHHQGYLLLGELSDLAFLLGENRRHLRLIQMIQR